MTKASAQHSAVFFSSELFADVQLCPLFEDSKTFADAIAKTSITQILQHYDSQKQQDDFSLKSFVNQHFEVRQIATGCSPSATMAKEEHEESQVCRHILTLWDELTRNADTDKESDGGGSLIPLPYNYIVPGGRFQEVYYWDSYFTALGLTLDGKQQLIMDTFKNFQFLIDDNGCVPNGNRDYYRGRSQPPVMALLLQLLQENPSLLPQVATSEFRLSALQSLRQEYDFWMVGKHHNNAMQTPQHRIVPMPDGSLLNRYWDDHNGPRPESYKEDVELAASLNVENSDTFYRHIRAACESGWDFSSRWLAQPDNLATIRTCDIVPVDLNCLLYFLERSLSETYASFDNNQEAQHFSDAAQARKAAIQKYLWNDQTGYYHDYCWSESQTTEVMSLAATLPLFFQLASKEQARSIRQRLTQQFLKPGGLVTTLTSSPQQWDSPNAWAPLQWFAVIGLENYGFLDDADTVMQHWLQNIEYCFRQHPGMMEKYNAENPGTEASGGEYLVQEGFGWTNGVTRAFFAKRKSKL